jgi:hypothetical protein
VSAPARATDAAAVAQQFEGGRRGGKGKRKRADNPAAASTPGVTPSATPTGAAVTPVHMSATPPVAGRGGRGRGRGRGGRAAPSSVPLPLQGMPALAAAGRATGAGPPALVTAAPVASDGLARPTAVHATGSAAVGESGSEDEDDEEDAMEL